MMKLVICRIAVYHELDSADVVSPYELTTVIMLCYQSRL